jgi:hypothetical protein
MLVNKFYINVTKIRKEQHANFLGVIIDEKLSWEAHIDLLSRNCTFHIPPPFATALPLNGPFLKFLLLQYF